MRNILLIACFGLWCCTTDKKETEREKEKQIENAEIQEVKTDDSEFSKYLDLIPNVELPFETNCERCCDHAQIDYDNEVIKRFRPEGTNYRWVSQSDKGSSNYFGYVSGRHDNPFFESI